MKLTVEEINLQSFLTQRDFISNMNEINFQSFWMRRISNRTNLLTLKYFHSYGTFILMFWLSLYKIRKYSFIYKKKVTTIQN